ATGAYAEHGIPAPVVAQYLRENRIVPEKNDLNSLLFLLTPGVEASKAGTLISGLIAFKKLHDGQCAAGGGDPRILPAAAGTLWRRTAEGPVRGDASLSPCRRCERVASAAVLARASAGDRAVAT